MDPREGWEDTTYTLLPPLVLSEPSRVFCMGLRSWRVVFVFVFSLFSDFFIPLFFLFLFSFLLSFFFSLSLFYTDGCGREACMIVFMVWNYPYLCIILLWGCVVDVGKCD